MRSAKDVTSQRSKYGQARNFNGKYRIKTLREAQKGVKVRPFSETVLRRSTMSAQQPAKPIRQHLLQRPRTLPPPSQAIPDLSRHIIHVRPRRSQYVLAADATACGRDGCRPLGHRSPGHKARPQRRSRCRRSLSSTAKLPQCDYVVVTWTVEEARCLADTLTPGFPSKTAWYQYAHQFETEYASIIRQRSTGIDEQTAGQLLPHQHCR